MRHPSPSSRRTTGAGIMRRPAIASALRARLLHGGLLVMATTVGVAGIASVTARQAHAADAASSAGNANRSYNIAAGPLHQALSSFAGSAGVTLAADPALTDGLHSPGLRGNHSVTQGFEQLLAGTGLTAVARGKDVFVLRKINTAAFTPVTSNSALPEIKVSAAAERSVVTEGTGAYTTPATAAATGLTLSPRDTPQSVSVVTRQQIDDQSLVSLSDVLMQVTGSDSDRNDFYSRGFYIDNLQYDGVPTSIGLSFFGESGNDSIIYDRIEVVRGATGLLTGAGEPSASINLVRKHANSKVFTGEVSAGVGSWNRYRASADLSTPLNADGSVRGRFIAMREERDSHVDLYHGQKSVMYGVIDADLSRSTTLSIGADYQANRPTGSTWGGLPLRFTDGSFTDWDTSKTTAANWTRWYSTNKTVFVNLEHRFDNDWKIKANLTHRESDYDAKLLYLFGTLDKNTGTGLRALRNYTETSFRQNSLDLQASGPFSLLGRKHELVVGVTRSQAKTDRANHNPGTAPGTGNFYQWDGSYPEPAWGPLTSAGSERITQDGLYSALRLSLSDPLKLIVGGRYSRWKSETGVASQQREHKIFTPYAGLIFDINSIYSAYASYTGIFQPQSYRDETGKFLDPVTGKNYEAGIKAEYLDGRVNASFGVFRIEQDNVGQMDPNTLVPGSTDNAYTTAKGVVSKGFEAEVSGELAPGWNLVAGVSFAIARDAKDQRINPEMPQTRAHLFTAYRLPGAWSALTVGGGVNWQSSSYYPFDNSAPFEQQSLTIVNVMARYAFTPKISGQININNLLDKKYYSNFAGQGQFGTPRNLMATLSYKF